MINELFLNNSKLNNFIQQVRLNKNVNESFIKAFNTDLKIISGDNDDLPF